MSSQKILKYNYEILLIDATYKTNKYKMPLIVISEAISLDTSNYIPFEFVFKETFEVDKWLVECIKNLYEYFNISDFNGILTEAQKSYIEVISTIYLLQSHLFCFWHMNKNMLVNCKKWFDNKA